MTSVLCHIMVQLLLLFSMQLYLLSIFNSVFNFVQWYGAVLHAQHGHLLLCSLEYNHVHRGAVVLKK